MKKRTPLLLTLIVAVCATAATESNQPASVGHENIDWPVYRGDPKGNQYVAMAQIHAANVHKLRPAWEYHTGDANQRSTMHANPIVVNGIMYITTPALKAVALECRDRAGDLGLRSGEVQQWRGRPTSQSWCDVLERAQKVNGSFTSSGIASTRSTRNRAP